MKVRKNRVSSIALSLAVGLFSLQAYALPNIDRPAGMSDLNDLTKGFDILLRGSDKYDENTIYFPWKRLRVASNQNGDPAFSFAYSQEGAYIAATLTATADLESIQKEFEKVKQAEPEVNRKNLVLAPLPVRSGMYRAVLSSAKTGDWVIGATEVAQAIPSNEVAVAMFFDKKAADLVVMALQGGAGVGWNYTYDFAARIVPYEANISIDWKSALEYSRNQFGLDSIFGTMQIDKITRKLIEKKVIEIQIIGGADYQEMEAATLDMAKIVTARMFKSTHPTPGAPDLKLPPARSGGITSVLFGDYSVRGAYQHNEMKSEEQVTETIRIRSQPYKIFTGTAGLNIGGYCNSHPHLVKYQSATANPDGTFNIMSGCPDRILPAKGDRVVTPPSPASYAPGNTAMPPSVDPSKDACKFLGNCKG